MAPAPEVMDQLREIFQRIDSPIAEASDEVVLAATAAGMRAFADVCDALDPVWAIGKDIMNVSQLLHAIGDLSEIIEDNAVQD